jgi:hypothetical protein
MHKRPGPQLKWRDSTAQLFLSLRRPLSEATNPSRLLKASQLRPTRTPYIAIVGQLLSRGRQYRMLSGS